MVQTVDSSAVTLIAADEIFKRVDVRVLADLCSDTNSRLGSATDTALMKTALSTDVNFLALKRDAMAAVEMACQVGGRYSTDDLIALVADAGVGAGALYRMVSRYLVVLAFERRPDREMKQPGIYEMAMNDIQALRDGERVFPFLETQEAGRFTHKVETAQDVEDRDGMVVQAQRFFGRRTNRRDRAWRQ